MHGLHDIFHDYSKWIAPSLILTLDSFEGDGGRGVADAKEKAGKTITLTTYLFFGHTYCVTIEQD